MSEIIRRVIYGAIYVALVTICVIYPPYATFGLMTLFGIVGFFEMQSIHKRKSKLYGSTLFGILLLIGFAFNTALSDVSFNPTTPLMLGFVLLVVEHIFTKGSEKSTQGINTSAMTLLYLGIPLSYAPLISNLGNDANPLPLMGVFVFIWTNDTFAYLVGRTIGKRKLSKRLSPKKSIEGFLGGLAFGLLAAYLVHQFTTSELTLTQWFILSLIAGVAGTLGDLFESALKRSAGVKDSGKLIPGHGGVLDRIDSFLFAAPLAYLYLSLT